MTPLEAMADKQAMEIMTSCAAAFDEGYRYPKRSTWRVLYLGFRLHFCQGSGFRRAEFAGGQAVYARQREQD